MYRIKDFNKSSKNMYLFVKIITVFIYILIIPIIIFNITLFIKSCINPNEIPDFFGYKTFVIVSESMEPTIMVGDAIFSRIVTQDELKENDIISFQDNGEINTHRIIDINTENDIIKYTTKGDNNKSEDKEKITYNKIEGVYQFRLKGFGKIIEILKNRITLILLLIALVLISAYQVRMNKKTLKRKEKRYEYNKNYKRKLN